MDYKFIIKTDLKTLKYLFEQREMDEAQQKWVSTIMGVKFEIHYKPGA